MQTDLSGLALVSAAAKLPWSADDEQWNSLGLLEHLSNPTSGLPSVLTLPIVLFFFLVLPYFRDLPSKTRQSCYYLPTDCCRALSPVPETCQWRHDKMHPFLWLASLDWEFVTTIDSPSSSCIFSAHSIFSPQLALPSSVWRAHLRCAWYPCLRR